MAHVSVKPASKVDHGERGAGAYAPPTNGSCNDPLAAMIAGEAPADRAAASPRINTQRLRSNAK